jgi:hypothetical protein
MFRLEPDAAEMRASGERILDIIIRTFEQLPREAAYRFRNSRAFADFYEDLRREPRDWQQVISRLETEGPSAASIRTPRHSCRSAPMRSGMAATANPADLSPSSSAAPLGVRRHDSSRAVQVGTNCGAFGKSSRARPDLGSDKNRRATQTQRRP